MRRIRARFGRLSVVPAAVGVGVVVLLGGVFFFACEWSLSKLVPRVSLNPPDTSIGSYLCVRSAGAPIRIVPVSVSNYREVIGERGVRDIDRVLVDAIVSVRSEGAGDTGLSDYRLVTRLHIRQNMSHPRATGLAMTPEDDLAVLEYLQANDAMSLPASLRGARELVVREWSRQGLIYNGLVVSALLLALGATVFGVWRVVRAERRFRAWVLTNCAYCGYSLEGLTIGRCPECGRVRMPRWR